MQSVCKCASCGAIFKFRPQTPKQRFCSQKACQAERRRLWQKARREQDPDYRANQARAAAAWAARNKVRNKAYWREYRARNPEYTKRNRELQRQRDRRRRDLAHLAKMNASKAANPVLSGLYELTPVRGVDLAKMDAWMVRIEVVTEPRAPSG